LSKPRAIIAKQNEEKNSGDARVKMKKGDRAKFMTVPRPTLAPSRLKNRLEVRANLARASRASSKKEGKREKSALERGKVGGLEIHVKVRKRRRAQEKHTRMGRARGMAALNKNSEHPLRN